MHIGRAGKCVDDDDDDSGGRTQRDCLTLAAPDRRPSQTRKFGFKGAANEKFGINCASAEAQFGTGRGIMVQTNLNNGRFHFEGGWVRQQNFYVHFIHNAPTLQCWSRSCTYLKKNYGAQ